MNKNEEKLVKARRAYWRKYYAENREHIREYRRAWYKAHPEKAAEYDRRHWEKVAALMEAEERAEKAAKATKRKAMA